MIRSHEGSGEVEAIRVPDMEEVLEKLEGLQNSPRGQTRQSLPALRRAIEVVYREEEDLLNRKMGMRRIDAMRSFSKIRGFNGFPSTKMAEE